MSHPWPSDIPTIFAKAQALRGALLRARTIASIEEELREFRQCASAGGIYSIRRNHENIWVRSRRCNDDSPFDNIIDLLYPPAGSPDFGRAQYPGSQIFYASWNLHTALEEIGAMADDLIQVVNLRVREPVELICRVVGELQFFHAAGRSQLRSGPAAEFLHQEMAADPLSFSASVLFNSVMAEIFRLPTKRPHDYKISAAYAEWYFQTGGGLIFPSVESPGAMNLAVPATVFDAKFEVLDTSVVRVVDYVGYGIYLLKTEHNSSNFADDGSIDWKNSTPVPSTRGPFGNVVIDPKYVGWRKT